MFIVSERIGLNEDPTQSSQKERCAWIHDLNSAGV